MCTFFICLKTERYFHFFEMGFARIDRCYFSLKWNLDKVFLLAVFAHRQMLFFVEMEFRQGFSFSGVCA